jgi:hypothetical protein
MDCSWTLNFCARKALSLATFVLRLFLVSPFASASEPRCFLLRELAPTAF